MLRGSRRPMDPTCSPKSLYYEASQGQMQVSCKLQRSSRMLPCTSDMRARQPLRRTVHEGAMRTLDPFLGRAKSTGAI